MFCRCLRVSELAGNHRLDRLRSSVTLRVKQLAIWRLLEKHELRRSIFDCNPVFFKVELQLFKPTIRDAHYPDLSVRRQKGSTQCANDLKRIGLATIDFQQTYARMPFTCAEEQHA